MRSQYDTLLGIHYQYFQTNISAHQSLLDHRNVCHAEQTHLIRTSMKQNEQYSGSLHADMQELKRTLGSTELAHLHTLPDILAVVQRLASYPKKSLRYVANVLSIGSCKFLAFAIRFRSKHDEAAKCCARDPIQAIAISTGSSARRDLQL